MIETRREQFLIKIGIRNVMLLNKFYSLLSKREAH